MTDAHTAGAAWDDQTNGRGFIGLAALSGGNRRAGGLAAGAGPFGSSDALQLRGRAAGVVARLTWSGPAIGGPPAGIVSWTPHLVILRALSLATQRLPMPTADGLVYPTRRALT
jgi:ABC-type uncharacterized transport system permease subunit